MASFTDHLHFWTSFLFTCVKIIGLVIFHCVTHIFPKTKKDLDEEVILITGAAHGLGKELAKEFAKFNATLVLWDINPEVFITACKIQSEGGNVWAYICDVTNESEVMKVAKCVQEDVGDVTILINNAGILQNQPFLDLNSNRIRKTFEVNVISHFWTIRAFLPKMIEKDKGHIVAISSVAGVSGAPNFTDYCASKFAVIGLMESLQEEIRRSEKKVVCTTICPAAIETGLIHKPCTKQPILLPILTSTKAASMVVDCVRENSFIVAFPHSVLYALYIIKFLPRKAREMVYDFIDYCPVPNKEPNFKEVVSMENGHLKLLIQQQGD